MLPSVSRYLVIWLMIQVSVADVFTAEELQKVDSFIQDVITCSSIPGLTLTVVKEDQVFTRGYGHTDIENNINTTTDSLFCIGSLTKAMTTTLLSKLLPAKFPDSVWDTKVKDILGEDFKLYTTELTEQVTLKDILTHRTGLVRGDLGAFAGYPSKISATSFVKRLRYLPTSKPLRYHFDYNNWMYFLAGYIAEALAGNGETWESLLRRHLLEPLGMTNTVFLNNLTELAESKPIALPYMFAGDKYQKLTYDIFNIFPLESAGAVCSSATDMSKWMKFLLQSTSAPKIEDIVDAKAFKDTLRPHQLVPYSSVISVWEPTFPINYVPHGYGLGWFLSWYRGRRQINHSGGLFAYTSRLWLYPDEKTGVFVSINGIERKRRSRRTVLSYISDVLLGLQPWLNSTTACTLPPPWTLKANTKDTPNSSEGVPSKRPLSDYSGTYGHKLIGDVTVSVNRTSNTLKFKLNRNIHAFLFPTKDKDVFTWKLVGPFSFDNSEDSPEKVRFYTSKDGAINSLVSSAVGKELIFRKSTRFVDSSASSRVKSGSVIFVIGLCIIAMLSFPRPF